MKSSTTSPSPLRSRHARRVAPALFFVDSDSVSRSDELMHKSLALCNSRRVRPGTPGDDSSAFFDDALRELATVQLFEANLIEGARVAVGQHASEAPRDADGLVAWLEGLRHSGPGQLDPLIRWLASDASYVDVRWYISQELSADHGVDALAHVTQTDVTQSVELGHLRNVAMLMAVAPAEPVWESLARSNLLTALASNQRWRSQAIGAMAALVMDASKRALVVETALTRLGYEVYPRAPRYDPRIIEALVRDAVSQSPGTARGIAEGALMWMHAAVRCLNRYRGELVGDATYG